LCSDPDDEEEDSRLASRLHGKKPATPAHGPVFWKATQMRGEKESMEPKSDKPPNKPPPNQRLVEAMRKFKVYEQPKTSAKELPADEEWRQAPREAAKEKVHDKIEAWLRPPSPYMGMIFGSRPCLGHGSPPM